MNIPLFPLNVVLFPGTTLPLHLFEPRYRQLLADIRQGDQRFGLLCSLPGVPEREVPVGRIGSLAEVTDVEMLPDGRSNIIVRGIGRFALSGYLETPTPYLQGAVEPVEDGPVTNPVALAVAADELAGHFRRIVKAVDTLRPEPGPSPVLSDHPVALAWQIAAMVDLDYETRVELLASTDPAGRVTRLDTVLRKVLPELELRAALNPGR